MKAKTQTLLFSLSSIGLAALSRRRSGWRRGTGRGGALLLELPLSSVLSPLVPRGERKKQQSFARASSDFGFRISDFGLRISDFNK